MFRYLFCLFFCFLSSCDSSVKVSDEILDIPVSIKLKRFDQRFVNVDKLELLKLKDEFPYLFNNRVKDTFWLKKSADSLQIELVNEVSKVFPLSYDFNEEFDLFYKHLKYYYPQIIEPEIVTLIGDVDYKNRVILTKELLLVSLDSYLGSDHHFYIDIQNYISNELKKDNLIIDVAYEYVKKIAVRANSRDFLSQMILHGKRQYLVSKLLPFKTDFNVLFMTVDEYNWSIQNESFIWRYFIEKDYLYSTDKNLLPRFLYPAPFSKFYLEIDQETPGEIGKFIGYQIVLAFMNNNQVSLHQLMEMDEKSIFELSKYKPKK